MIAGWTAETVAGHRVECWRAASLHAPVLLFLHPYGREMPSTNLAFSEAFRNAGVNVVAPEGGTSWWSDRICPDFSETHSAEHFIVHEVFPWIQTQYGQRPIAVAGISMGGQGALRLGFKYPKLFPVVASIAGAFDYHEWHGRGTTIDAMYRNREACRQDTAILQVRAEKYPPHIWLACDTDDEWYRGNDRLVEKLKALGIPHTTDFRNSCGGHSWTFFDSMAMPMVMWCVSMLQKESRRLH